MAPGRFNTSRFISTAPISVPMTRSDLILSNPFAAKKLPALEPFDKEKLPGAKLLRIPRRKVTTAELPGSSMPKQYCMTGQWKIPATISSHK
jgi:hypothetical protein